MGRIKNDNYFQVSGWMINELGLKGNELLVYAIIYGFSQDEATEFTGSTNYLAEFTNVSKSTVMRSLENLVKKGYVLKNPLEINGVKFNRYKIARGGVKMIRGWCQNDTGVVSKCNGGSVKMTPNNNIYNNINNNIYIKEEESTQEELILFLPLKDGSSFPITQKDINNYREVYNTIDVIKEIKKAILWCDSNVSNRKTKTGAKRFINGWLSRAETYQEKNTVQPPKPKKESGVYVLKNGTTTTNPFIAMLEEEMEKELIK